MSVDILYRLRAMQEATETGRPTGFVKDIWRTAADEIEHLRSAASDGAAEEMRQACLAICADYGKDIKNDAIQQVFAQHVCDKIAARIRELNPIAK
jgi:hypothetical protein